ncbi:MAG: tetratricopeptide repeat protein [Bacteroidia bacterium]|nr:tetratricopeptide repeat protein [Bacteroidia bacterium]
MTDSLLALIKKDKEDSSKINHLNNLGWELMYQDPDTSIILGNQALSLSQKLCASSKDKLIWFGKKGMASSLGNLGVYYHLKSDYQKALEYYTQATTLSEELLRNSKNPAERKIFLSGISARYGNMGLAYADQGNYPKGLEYYLKALKIDETAGNKSGMINHLCNMGIVYKDQGDYSASLAHYTRALKLIDETGNKSALATILGNVASIYKDQGNFTKAIDYCFQALKTDSAKGNLYGMARHTGNIGLIYSEQGDSAVRSGNNTYAMKSKYLLALEYYFKALKLDGEIGNKNGEAAWYNNIGVLYTKTKKFKEATTYLQKAIEIDSAIGNLKGLIMDEDQLSKLYENTGKDQQALIHYKKSRALQDSVFSEENKKQLLQKEMNFNFEKKEAVANAEHKKELESQGRIADEKSRKQNVIMLSVISCLLLVVVFAAFVFRSLRITRKQKTQIEVQKREVEMQKELVEEKQKEILDSIYYARRIQRALITSEKYIGRNWMRLRSKNQ